MLVDEASNFYWVFTHKSKDQAATVLTDTISGFLKAGHMVKSLRSDRDTGFMSKNFQRFLQKRNIQHEPTSGYTPQENGHSERAVGVLKQIMQSLLSDSGLNDRMWGEAVHHATYIHNISSSTGSVTPWETIHGTKPDASVLRLWGCKAWKLIPPEKRSKSFDIRKSEQVRFVGFAWPNAKAYRVLNSKGTIEITTHL